MKTKLLTALFLLFPICLFSQNYEKEGDDLFAQAQYEQAEKKYKAAIAISGESQTIKQKQDKCTKCKSLLAKAQTAEKESRYSDAAKYYSDLYAIHALPKYQSKANAMKQRAQQAELAARERLAKERAEKERLAREQADQERQKIEEERAPRGSLYNGFTWKYLDGVLTIYGEGDLKGASILKDIPSDIKDKIEVVVISNTITSIGARAFIGRSKLTSVVIPESVTRIGDYAFSDCTRLLSINITKSVNEIGNKAFTRCYALSITLPKRFQKNVDLSDCKSVTYY